MSESTAVRLQQPGRLKDPLTEIFVDRHAD